VAAFLISASGVLAPCITGQLIEVNGGPLMPWGGGCNPLELLSHSLNLVFHRG